ncbi:MAG: hypothetical protein IIA89_15565 [Chloroflexi bacterium]|nr:hypothetical protein [Chloroflexota bacterium]
MRDFQNTPSDRNPFPPHPVQFLYTLAMIAVGYVLLALAARKESDEPWTHRKWRVVGYAIIAIPALTGLVYIMEEITKILERAG